MTYTLFAPALKLMIDIVTSYGIDPDPIMRELEINPALVNDPSARYRLERIRAFDDRVADLIPDANFGLKGAELWHPSQLGALGYAWMTSDTLRAAFKRLQRFIKVINNEADIRLLETPGSLTLVLELSEAERLQAFRTDGAMAILLAMTRANAGQDFHPQSVSFTHPEPEDSGPFYALFRCPVAFSASSNSFTISASDADEHRSCSNSQLALLHDQLLIEYVAKLDKENIVERVKAAIIKELASGNISDAIVAQSLNMTERTLQRRLREQGVTFKTLLNEMRRELADSYIRDNKLSLSEISFMLGFAEISSFSHAFKRWTGKSPTSYRSSSQV